MLYKVKRWCHYLCPPAGPQNAHSHFWKSPPDKLTLKICRFHEKRTHDLTSEPFAFVPHCPSGLQLCFGGPEERDQSTSHLQWVRASVWSIPLCEHFEDLDSEQVGTEGVGVEGACKWCKTVPMCEILPTRGAGKQPMTLCVPWWNLWLRQLMDLDSQPYKNNLCWI